MADCVSRPYQQIILDVLPWRNLEKGENPVDHSLDVKAALDLKSYERINLIVSRLSNTEGYSQFIWSTLRDSFANLEDIFVIVLELVYKELL